MSALRRGHVVRTRSLPWPSPHLDRHSSDLSNFIRTSSPPFRHSHLLLRSCKSQNHLSQVHAHLTVLGATTNPATCAVLLNSYSSHRNLPAVESIFRSLNDPTVVSCNSVIRAYAAAGKHEEAVLFYRGMTGLGMEPDKYTFTFVLKACAGVPDYETGASVHQEVARRGLETDVYVRTALVGLYSKLGMVETARELFDLMPSLDVVSWNAMIGGFSKNGQPEEAIRYFKRMQSIGVEPNSVTLLNLFRSVCELSDALLCKELHGFMFRRPLHTSVCNGLIDAYSKSGDVRAARRVFDWMVQARDAVSWGTMISAYVVNGQFYEALEMFDSLKHEGIRLNIVSIVSAILAATETKDVERGMHIHDCTILEGLNANLSIVTALISMYAKCDMIDKARDLFNGIYKKDTIAWSAMISALAQSGHPTESLNVFRKMQEAGTIPNRVTLVSILPACAELLDLKSGKSIHAYALKFSSELDRATGTAIISMYAKCGCFSLASAMFDILPHKDIVTWNALINGYAQIGDACNALKLFHQLQYCGLHPDPGTIVGVLPACTILNALDHGMSVHALIVKYGFEEDLHVKNAIVDLYAKCGCLKNAEALFAESHCKKDVISWNTMIAGYMHSGRAKEAISAFHQLQNEGLKPNLVTLVSVLPAAAYLSALKYGMSFHSYAVKTGLDSFLVIGNSLIDMYSKCGRLDCAQEVFQLMYYRDAISWNAMISGYAIHGHGERAIALFSQMLHTGLESDCMSFIGVLSACRHSGLIEEGKRIFESMISEHQFEPKLEHYACMVDMLARAGRLDEAWDVIGHMPLEPDSSVWGAFLDGCRMHSNIQMGKVALDHLVRLEGENATPYVALSSMYAQLGEWFEALEMRKTMKHTGLSKSPGCSWLYIENDTHTL